MATTLSFLSPEDWTRILMRLELSPRERELLPAALAGTSEEDIATTFGISRNTVHGHMRRIYAKLGARDRAQLVLRVFQVYVEMHRHANL